MKQVSIDVLVTFYNQEKYVDRALQSILSQKGDFSLNVLVGDDGSSDGTMEQLQSWKERYPKQISIFVMSRGDDEITLGTVRASRNRLNLVRHVKSDFFTFLDGDDFYDDIYKIQKQIDILEDDDNYDCIACGHPIDVLFEDGTRAPFIQLPTNKKKYTLKEYWTRTYLHTDTIVFRRSALLLLPNKLFENRFDDNGITFLFLHAGKMYYLPQTMAVYYQTGDGLWSGESEVRKLFLEMLMYDTIMKYDPSLKHQTRFRFFNAWERLFAMRKTIDSHSFIPYLKEAQEYGLSYSELWINYNCSGIRNHIRLYKEFLLVKLSRTPSIIVSKVKRKFCKIIKIHLRCQ